MFRRRRSPWGQHFLADGGAIERIVGALEIQRGEPVLEIGPGRGALTTRLIAAAGRVVAVEIDPRLVDRLRDRFAAETLDLVQADVCRVSLAEIRDRVSTELPWAIAGNLPYGVSKPVAMKLVTERAVVDRAVLMFQREVAERLTASPGRKSYGPLTVLAGAAYDIRPLFHLGPRAFRPPPKVSSTVTLWKRLPPEAFDAVEERRLRACLRACFARRRRTLRNNLLAASGSAAAVDHLLERSGLDGAARAETIEPAGFRRLASCWDEVPTPGSSFRGPSLV